MFSSNRLYYRLKPYLPWWLRMNMRRILAGRQRRIYKDTWPISETAGQAPEGWQGWPDGKKFALVLTHDVEGSRGLEKCRQLMELEKKLGFRSSFNFVPEGDYRVSREQREELEKMVLRWECMISGTTGNFIGNGKGFLKKREASTII